MAITWLVTDPHGVEEPAERHRRRHLVADVAGVVEVEAALQHHPDQPCEMLDELGAGRRAGGVALRHIAFAGERRCGPAAPSQTAGGRPDPLHRLHPKKHGALPTALHSSKV